MDEIDRLNDPIIRIYNKIEEELLREIAGQFKVYDDIGGTMEWQVQKLDELGGLNAHAVKIIEQWSGKAENAILEMLTAAGYAFIDKRELAEAYRANLFRIDPDVLMETPVLRNSVQNSFRETKEAFRLINTKALESTRQNYMDVINQSYLEVSSGVYDYSSSIRRGLLRMAERGINGATYQRSNGKIVRYSLEGTVRRDTLSANFKLANANSYAAAEEGGAEYMEITRHLGARVHPSNPIANHAGWQGKVFKIHGFDENYGNLKTNTGYPDDIEGLGGVNCRHGMRMFFPGISSPKKDLFTPEENARKYKLTQQQRAKEREIRKLKKQCIIAEAAEDAVMLEASKKKLRNCQNAMNDWCKENGLKRDWNREMVTEELKRKE